MIWTGSVVDLSARDLIRIEWFLRLNILLGSTNSLIVLFAVPTGFKEKGHWRVPFVMPFL